MIRTSSQNWEHIARGGWPVLGDRMRMGLQRVLRQLLHISLLTCCTVVESSSCAAPGERPNILFILTDDLGIGDVGCYGQKQVKTPHIDKLAAEGMRFTQAYAGSTVCAPSRSCLLTGQDTGHTLRRGNAGKPLQPSEFTIAELLKNAGYYNSVIGKWGMGDPGSVGVPSKHGFDESYGYMNHVHAHTYYTTHLFRNEKREELTSGSYSHDLFTSEAVSFLKRKHEKPFFLFLSFTIPHTKLEVPSLAPYANESWPAPQKIKAAMITRMDASVGKVMDTLREQGVDDNTLVLFSSDNGPYSSKQVDHEFFDSNGLFRGYKRDLYEGGIRVPLIARWPGKVQPGSTSDHVCAFWDFMPTFAELTAQPAPEKINGKSILPTLLARGNQAQHEYLYWEFHERGSDQAIRMGDWKAVKRDVVKPTELYNLAKDPAEANNVAAQQPEVLKQVEAVFKTARISHPDYPMLELGKEPSAQKQKKKKNAKAKTQIE